jgi:4-hydroxybenzoate polyprenyltransferase
LLKRILNFLIFSNIYVAIPVSFLVFQSTQINNVPFDFVLLLFVYSSTLLVYNYHRTQGLNNILKSDLSLRILWAIDNIRLLKTLVVLSFIVSLVSAIFIAGKMLYLMPVGLLTLGYVVPFIKVGKRFFRLRDIPGIKATLIAISVSYVTCVIPLIGQLEPGQIGLQFIERVFFILAITIPFDIRDMKFDGHSNLKTLPIILGVKKSKIGAVVLVWFSIGLSCLIDVHYSNELVILYAKIASAFITSAIILKSNENSSEYYYSFLVEGTMIIQTLLIVAALTL